MSRGLFSSDLILVKERSSAEQCIIKGNAYLILSPEDKLIPLEMFFYFDSWTVRIETVLGDYLIQAILFSRRKMTHREALSLAQSHTA